MVKSPGGIFLIDYLLGIIIAHIFIAGNIVRGAIQDIIHFFLNIPAYCPWFFVGIGRLYGMLFVTKGYLPHSVGYGFILLLTWHFLLILCGILFCFSLWPGCIFGYIFFFYENRNQSCSSTPTSYWVRSQFHRSILGESIFPKITQQINLSISAHGLLLNILSAYTCKNR